MVLSPDEPIADARRDRLRSPSGFRVSLGVFDGPFDLLLTLISKHELDITEVSLSRVTDEFIAYLRELDADEELEQASEFLVVAATLLDMKVAGLLPQGELVDAESVALLEARDLLFARLLQYRAFKEVSAWFAQRLQARGPPPHPHRAARREVPSGRARARLDADARRLRGARAPRDDAEGDPARRARPPARAAREHPRAGRDRRDAAAGCRNPQLPRARRRASPSPASSSRDSSPCSSCTGTPRCRSNSSSRSAS